LHDLAEERPAFDKWRTADIAKFNLLKCLILNT